MIHSFWCSSWCTTWKRFEDTNWGKWRNRDAVPVIPALGNALPFLPSGAAGGRFASCVNFFFCEIHLDNFLSICYNKSTSTFRVEKRGEIHEGDIRSTGAGGCRVRLRGCYHHKRCEPRWKRTAHRSHWLRSSAVSKRKIRSAVTQDGFFMQWCSSIKGMFQFSIMFLFYRIFSETSRHNQLNGKYCIGSNFGQLYNKVEKWAMHTLTVTMPKRTLLA